MTTLTAEYPLAETIALIESRFARLDAAAEQIQEAVESMVLHLRPDEAGAQ
jgi:hypothetical protein